MIDRLFFIYILRRWIEQNARILLRVLVIAGVLLGNAYLARRPSQLYIVLLLSPIVVFILARYPSAGLAAVILGLAIPFGLGTGSETELNPPFLLLVLLAVLWILDMTLRRDIRLVPSRTTLPIIAFLIVTLLAFGVGQLSWFVTNPAPIRAQLGGVAIFVVSMFAFLLVGNQVLDLRWLERLIWVFLAVGAVYIAGRLIPGLGSLTSRIFLYGADGSLFWTWLVAIGFSQAVFNHRMRPFWRYALGGLVLATIFIGLIQQRAWTSGWAPPLVAIAIIVWVGSPKWGLFITLVGAAAAVTRSQSIISFVDVGDTDYSVMTRFEAWRILFQIIKVNPLLGLGPANYYWYTPLFPILGYAVKFNSHNNYVDLVAQTGIAGLICFLWFAWEVGRLAWRLKDLAPEGFATAYVYGALGGLAGTLAAAMLGDWVIPFVYNIGFKGFRSSVLGWLFLGGVVVIEQVTRQLTTDHSLRAANESI